MTKVLVKKLHDDVVTPQYAKPGDSGMDVRAYLPLEDEVLLRGNYTVVIPTGLTFQIPEGTEIQVRSRSGAAAKYGLFVLNSPGTLDSGYRGELKVILHNSSSSFYRVFHGDRIAQIVLCPVLKADIEVVDELEDTERGEGGFGSTGV